MFKTIGINILSLVLIGCGGNPPKMERPVAVWNGAPEYAGICRINPDKLAHRLNLPVEIIRDVVAEGVECIQATDPSFQKYGCMTFDDIGVLQKYTETLINRCEKWKP